jgi:hypothetical protein
MVPHSAESPFSVRTLGLAGVTLRLTSDCPDPRTDCSSQVMGVVGEPDAHSPEMSR